MTTGEPAPGTGTVTVLAPVRPAARSALLAALHGLDGDPAPLAAAGRTHMARLSLVDGLPYLGPPQRVDVLRMPQLLFTSSFDGPLPGYLAELFVSLGPVAQRVWGCCAGYPDPANAASFSGYLAGNRVPEIVFYAAHPRASVPEVRRALRLRQALRAVAESTQSGTPGDVEQAFAALEEGL